MIENITFPLRKAIYPLKSSELSLERLGSPLPHVTLGTPHLLNRLITLSYQIAPGRIKEPNVKGL